MKLDISQLGPRIAIIGGSNAGKSTLATKLGDILNMPVKHLDQYRFEYGTIWVKRPKHQFLQDVELLSGGTGWVIEGSYDSAVPILIKRATTIIHLTPSRWVCLYRYIRLHLLMRLRLETRLGMPNMPDRMSWNMLHWIIWKYPKDDRSIQPMLKLYEGRLIEAASLSFAA